jgi:hypothetical protein
MADTLQTLALLVLEQKFRGRMVSCINRRSAMLRLLPLVPAVGKNCAWGAKGSGQVAERYSEGADASNFGSNSKDQAILTWGLLRSNFHNSGTARRASALSATPEGVQNLVAENIEDATMELTSLINVDLHGGPGTTDTIAGLTVATGSVSNTYATIDRTSKSFWRPYVVDPGSLTPLSFAQIRTDQSAIFTASGETPDIALCSPDVMDTLAALFDDNRRYNATVDTVTTARGKIVLDAGYEGIMFNGTVFFKDKDATANTIQYLNSRFVHVEYLPPPADMMVQLGEMGIMVEANDGFGAIPLGFMVEKLAKSGDSDKYMLTFNGQLVVRKPNSCGVRKNITIAV